jgi:hypothetical protein
MTMPGFTAAKVLEIPARARWRGLSNNGQGSTAIAPALHTETWYSCYSKPNGDVGWCGEICEDDDCYTTYD